ncbi:site-specific integrase [Salinirubellus salinus]|uniref:Site-specific integrase n=1 Tax=Salinirubellus salinus TaxID=1364945 RepID=A0A9E7R202_9EURY|nr:site-specific integrase [Salinirubellus salinus]UWM54131.1 site-specific integrase [Salinirubellus salinus]
MKIENAIQIYVEHRSSELSQQTIEAYEYRLRFFVEWCEENGLEEIENVSKKDVHDFLQHRKQDLAKTTYKANTDTLRACLRYIEKLDFAEEGVHEVAESPTLTDSENVRDDIVPREKAEQILNQLDKFRYASKEHALFQIFWETAARTGAVRGLDVEDYNAEQQYIEFHHRPEYSTPLKNADNGQRLVSLSSPTCVVLDDYIAENRLDTQDEHGRHPLLTTPNGRIAANTIRKWSYRVTCPEFYAECDCGKNTNYKYECENSVGAHAWRRGAITHWLESDKPKEVVSDRAQVSERILEKHYDGRDERTKMEQRRQFFTD